MRRFENYWAEEARWEEEQARRRSEKRRRTREERRIRAREQMLTIIGVCLFLLAALLATTAYAESLAEETPEIAQSSDDGRLSDIGENSYSTDAATVFSRLKYCTIPNKTSVIRMRRQGSLVSKNSITT